MSVKTKEAEKCPHCGGIMEYLWIDQKYDSVVSYTHFNAYFCTECGKITFLPK